MRTFVAVEISNVDVINSIKKTQSEIRIDAKPVESRNFHFTLQFLGEVPDEILQKVIQSLRTIEFSGFDVKLEGVGCFPRAKFPRVIWVGTNRESGDLLTQLSKKVEKVLEPLGFHSDKPFKSHITIFRIKKKIGDITKELERKKTIDFGIQKVTSIKLKKSELTSSGSIYSDLEEIKAIQ